jgi:hypothetical protein
MNLKTRMKAQTLMRAALTSLASLPVFAALGAGAFAASPAPSPDPGAVSGTQPHADARQVLPLNGDKWLIDIDPDNTGIASKWFDRPTEKAKPITIPGVIQTAFPNYHGLAWCWLDFAAPANPHPHGRYLLKFKSVSYKADVWVNGIHLMTHEGQTSPL